MARVTAVTHSSIESLRGYVDRERGIAERFEPLQLGGVSILGVLSAPLGAPLDLGWVICHSFGMEQTYLQPLEAAMARSLAAEGFPVLRFQGRGYGETDAPIEVVGLESHVEDAERACAALASATGVSRLGLLGARFGGTVAAVVADRLDATAMLLWEPAVNGSAYLNSIIRAGLVIDLADVGRARGRAKDPQALLREEGVLDVHGFPVTRLAFEQISSVSLPSQLGRFRGQSLVIQVSRSDQPTVGTKRLVARLQELGGSAAMEVVADQEAAAFGLPRYLPTGQGDKADRQAVLSAELVERSVAWSRQLPAISARRGTA